MSGSKPDQPFRISLLRYSPALILVAIAIADSQRWADPDLWGHVRFGQAVLAAGHVVRRDPYSYSAPGHLWVNHEWLCEVLMGFMYNAMGSFGLKLMKFACSAAAVVLIADAIAECGASVVSQTVILVATSVAISPHLQVRPQMFTLAAFPAIIAILSRFTYRGGAPLWMAVPLIALWSVLHGGFIMGLAALGVFGGMLAAQDLAAGRGIGRGSAVLIIMAAAALATLLMPYGRDTWRAVLHALENPFTRMVMDDWQWLPHDLLQRFFDRPFSLVFPLISIAMFLALVVSVAMAPASADLPLLAVAGVMSIAAIASTRNVSTATIAIAVPLAYHLRLWMDARRGRASEIPERSSLANQAAIAAIAMAMLIFTGLFSRRLAVWKPLPAGAVAFMRANRLSGNLLTTFGWGEYAIWHLWPQDKVFIDGRYDTVFPLEVISDYLAFHYADDGAPATLRKYPHDFILLPVKNVPAYDLVRSLKDWTLIYHDQTCALFARADSQAASLSAVAASATMPGGDFP